MTRASRGGATALLVLILSAAGPAAADKSNAAEFDRAYQAGIDAYHLGKLDEARERFEYARRVQPDLPGPHRQLAAVAYAQSRFEDCLASAAAALRVKPDSDQSDKVRELHAECRAKLGRPALAVALEDDQGALAVRANVDDAVVLVNGLTVGPTPLAPRPTAIGPVMIEVRKEGYLEASRKVVIVGGIVSDVDIRLRRDPRYRRPRMAPERAAGKGWLRVAPSEGAAEGPTVRVDGGDPPLDPRGRMVLDPGVHEVSVEVAGYEPWRRRVQIADGQLTSIDLDLVPAAERRRQRVLAWSALGGAALAAGTGFAFTVAEMRSFEQAQDIHDRELSRPSGVPIGDTVDIAPVGTRADIDRLRDRGEKQATWAAVSYGVAAAALGTSIYFFLRARRSERPGLPPPFAIVPTAGEGAGVAVTSEVRW
jgi:hypothetical protein